MAHRTLHKRTSQSQLHRILWADFTAGAVVGAALLVLSVWLEEIYSIPRAILLFMGAAGLLYASFALALAVNPAPPSARVVLLGSANLVWSALCVLIALAMLSTASWLGLAHLAAEAAFVSWLGINELRHRYGGQAVEVTQGAT
jgi:hypothetical protein